MVRTDLDIKRIRQLDELLQRGYSIRAAALKLGLVPHRVYRDLNRMGYRVTLKIVPIQAPPLDAQQEPSHD